MRIKRAGADAGAVFWRQRLQLAAEAAEEEAGEEAVLMAAANEETEVVQ